MSVKGTPELRKYDHLWVGLFNQDGEISEPWYKRARPEPKRPGMHRWRKRNGSVENVAPILFPKKTDFGYAIVERVVILDEEEIGKGDIIKEIRLDLSHFIKEGDQFMVSKRGIWLDPKKLPGVVKWRVNNT